MKRVLQVENVKCQGCATTLKNRLQESFGSVEVNLETIPREITLDVEDEKMEELGEALKKLGYPLSCEKLNFIENTSAKAKSFISCAVGKIEQK